MEKVDEGEGLFSKNTKNEWFSAVGGGQNCFSFKNPKFVGIVVVMYTGDMFGIFTIIQLEY